MITDSVNILVDFDSLLDTRMGVIDYMGKQYSKSLIDSNKYFSRISDKFDVLLKTFDQQEFDRLYVNRTKEMIEGRVYPTLIGALIHNLVAKTRILTTGGPHEKSLKVTVNTYPYVFTKEDSAILKELCSDNFECEVEVISMDITFLSPVELISKYTDMIIYDLDLWLNIHMDTLLSRPMPRFAIYAPAIVVNSEMGKSKKDIETKMRSWEGPITMQQNFSAHVSLNFLQIEHFCFHVGTETDQA